MDRRTQYPAHDERLKLKIRNTTIQHVRAGAKQPNPDWQDGSTCTLIDGRMKVGSRKTPQA